jgi:hypothetical protein
MDATIISTIILGSVGVVLTIYYSHHSKQIARDIMMKELFTEFNRRYDELNDDLQFIHDHYRTTEELQKAENYAYLKNRIIDFFNICAEEYFWYQKDRIDKNVWMSWNAGMKFWYRVPAIKDLWIEETKEEGLTSYYITNGKHFFQ